MRILIAEDNRKLAASLKKGLEQEGYSVDCAYDGTEAQSLAVDLREAYDLLILDIMLPGQSGIELCRKLRAASITVPVLMLTARHTVDDRIEGLDSGADDYLTKPFSFAELAARIRALLRRPRESSPVVLRLGEIALDPRTHEVRVGSEEVGLTVREYQLLEVLIRHPGQVLTRDQIVSRLWDFDSDPFSNVVDVHVRNLRKKLSGAGHEQAIETIRGVGYRLKA